MTLSNAQGSVTLAMKSHGFHDVSHQPNAEYIRVTVQVRSATGNGAGLHVRGSIKLTNLIVAERRGSVNPHAPFSAQIHLRPSR